MKGLALWLIPATMVGLLVWVETSNLLAGILSLVSVVGIGLVGIRLVPLDSNR